jgi:hypothetical protein
MTQRDETTQHDPHTQTPRRATDDRRGQVRPHEYPVPSSPEAEEDAVREGEEKLGRVKPY